MGKKKLPHESLTPKLVDLLLHNRVQFYTQTSDNSPTLYQDLVTLIDSPSFITKVVKSREKLKIERTPFADPFDIAKNSKIFTLPKDKKNDRDWFKKSAHKYFITSLMDNNFWAKILKFWHKGNTEMEDNLRTTALKILKEIDRPWYYTDATMQTILLGMCGWSHTGKLLIVDDTYIPKPTLTIIINPRTTYTDVEQTLRNIKSNELRDFKLPPPVNNIENYQYWYWEKLKGKTYAQIALDCSNQLEEEFENAQKEDPQIKLNKRELAKMHLTDVDVLKGVNKYSSLLAY